MIDKTQVTNAVDLFAELQPEFTQKGCKLVRPIEFCVPVTKTNVNPPPAVPNIVGQPLKDDYVCYLLKCPDKPTVPARFVADQFGRRLQRKYMPVKLCVPARKAAPPCGATTSAKQCGGTCPEPAAECRYDSVAKQCTCAATPTCDGKPDAAGHCGGVCATVGDVCQPVITATGNVGCGCQPPPVPSCDLNSATGTCGGSCPNPSDQCVLVTTASGVICRCQPVEAGCPANPPAGATCGGTCTDPGLQCVRDPLTNQCRCEPPPSPCGANPATGQCGGACPAPETCKFINNGTTGVCQCQ